jgi:hypothetical protein
MSLQHAAKYLANQGRGKDTMLVHMTPREVGSLQTLAKAQGGSLSINPDTGLPEAGFLDSMLPMIVGGGLMAMGVPAPMIGLGVGGLQTLRTGNIGKGISAGLGAYGGAGLAGGLAGMGADTIANQQVPMNLDMATATPEQVTKYATDFQSARDAVGPMDALGAGAAQAFNNPSQFVTNMEGGANLAKTGLAAAAPLLMDTGKVTQPQVQGSGPNPYRYRFERGEASPFPEASRAGVERSYFPNARYVQYAGGGAVEAMSDANAIGANTGFPMADISRGAYATPYQQPISQNVVTGAGDTRVDPYSGEERLADGGTAEENPLLSSPYFVTQQLDNREGGGTAPPAPPSNGSPTGSIAGDIGYALSGIPGISGAIASALMDSFSSISPTSINAINGLDAQSDAATAAGLGNAPTVSDAATTSAAISDSLGGFAASESAPSVSDGGPAGDGAAGEANGGLLHQKYAMGGLSDLGGYSDGGRLLRGPGDGVSDSIPAVIGKKQPARLADGEFVVPARIVSELGNGSTEAGARKLYAMLDRVQKARGKTVGKGKVAHNSRADKYLPA